MAAFRFSCLAGSLLILASAVPAWSQSPESGTPTRSPFKPAPLQTERADLSIPLTPICATGEEGCCAGCGTVAVTPIRKTYSLAEICDDPTFGAWVAEMIPQVVQPGSWNKGDTQNRHVLSYFAPGKMLLVYHTPAAHAEIDDLLRGMKKSMPTTRATAKAPALHGLSQASYSVPEPRTESAPAPNGYPVAAPVHQPRHLFHFIIRYEGDGIIDQNVAEFAKVYSDAAASAATAAVNQAPPTPTKSDAAAKEEATGCSKAPAASAAPAACNSPTGCPMECPLVSTGMNGVSRSSTATATPHVPNNSSPRSEPATVRFFTPAPAPNYPVPAIAPASRNDEEE